MPLMDLTFPAGAIDAGARAGLIDDLTTALLRAERAPDTDFFRSITWVFVNELPADNVYAAGRPVEAPIARLIVTTPDGALSDRRRAEMVEAATQLIRDALGIAEADALTRIWVVHRTVADGSWGAGGQVVRFSQLRELAAREREQAAAPAGD